MNVVKNLALYSVLIVFFVGAFFYITVIPPSDSAQPNPETPMEQPRAPLKRVYVVEVEPRPFEETILLPGTVEAFSDVTVASPIPGIVEGKYVKEGDMVKKGQELFQIDLRAREARLAEAKAAHELAQKTLVRTERLRKNGNLTVQEYDEAVSRELQTAALVRTMEVEVSLGHVSAPMDGIVDHIDAEVGEYMHDGTPLARLLNLDKVKVKVGVPERYADAVANEKAGKIILEALNEVKIAKLNRIAYEANQETNTFEATLILDNPERRFRPGMLVRVELVTKRVKDGLLVPINALVKRVDGMCLIVEKDGVVETRPVVLGSFEKTHVEILEGLKPYERVVIRGQEDLVDGQQVVVMPDTNIPTAPLSEGQLR